MPKEYPEEYKQRIIQDYQNGMPIQKICQINHVAVSTIYRWLKDCEGEISAPRYSVLLHKKEHLEHVLEVIQLSDLIDEVPLRRRLDILETLHAQHEEYNIHELCEALNVARGTFYNHIFRRVDRSKYEKEQAQLMLQVQQIFDDSQQRFGAEKIRIILAKNGIHVGKKRIRDIMQELGLESIRENAKKDYKKRQEYQRKNLLEQNFTASRQNEIWVSDITYFKVKDYSIYFCVIIDLFSRKILGYRASRKYSVQLVLSTFKKAFQNRGSPTNLTFHSDRGGQYISGAFCALLRKCGVKQSFSKSGCPHDNAVVEAFFSTFKREET